MKFWVLLPLIAAAAVALPAYPYTSSGSYLTNFPGPVQYGPEARKNLQGVVGTATTATQSLATWQLKQLRRKWIFIICMMDASCPSIAFPDKHPWAPAPAIRSYPDQFRIDHLDEEPIRSYPNQFRIDDMDEELFRPYPIQFRIDDLDEEPIHPYPLQFRIDDLADEMQHREMVNQMLTPNQFVANEVSTNNHLGTNQMFTPNRFVADESTPNHLSANQMVTPNHLIANQMTPNRLVADEMPPNRFVANQISTPNQLVANQMQTQNQLVANKVQPQNQLASNQKFTPNPLAANQMFTPNRLIPDDGKDSIQTNAMPVPTNIRGVNKSTSKLVGLAEFQMAQWVWRWNIILCFVNPSCPHVNIPSPTTRFGRQYPPIRVDVEKMRMMAETQQQPRVMFPVSFVRD